MKKALRIGLKYCGNCNPHISCQDVSRKIVDESYRAHLSVEFVPWDWASLDALLVISGCPTDCASRPSVNCPEIIVAGESVNLTACSADDLSSRVLDLLFALGK